MSTGTHPAPRRRIIGSLGSAFIHLTPIKAACLRRDDNHQSEQRGDETASQMPSATRTACRVHTMAMTEIRVPTTIGSNVRASIGRWFKRSGDAVTLGEPVVEIETGSGTIEVQATVTGVLSKRLLDDGQSVRPGDLLGTIATY